MGNKKKKFNKIIIKKKNEINKNFFLNFRSHPKKFIAEVPSVKLNTFIKKLLYNHQIKHINFLYNKIIKRNNDLKKIIKSIKLDDVGNPGYWLIDGNKINERYLRHCHLFNLFKKKIPISKINYVTDIGGGYGSFARMIHKKYKKLKIIIIDLPEQLMLAKYYLSTNFPKSRVSNLKDVYKIKKIDKNFLNKFEIILVPNTEFKKIEINFKKNLIINFNSFGEIDHGSFLTYLKSKILRESKYFFSVNRLDSFPTYNNNISIVDYKFEKYKKIHSAISPIWDIYYTKKFYLFLKKNFFSSRVMEFIGSK